MSNNNNKNNNKNYYWCNNKNNNNRYNDSSYSYNKSNSSGKRSPVDKYEIQIVETNPAMNTKIAPIVRENFPQVGQ